MTSKLAIILLMCGAAWGQQADKHPARKDPRNFLDAPPITQEPVEKLTCLEYQHVDHWPGRCGPQQCDATSCFLICSPVPPDKCVDDLHTVTEREWAELMARLKALEHPIVVDGTSAGDCKTPPDDPTKPCDKNQPSRKGKK